MTHELLITVASLVAKPDVVSGSEVVVHGLSCPVPCGIFLDKGSDCPWHWQADS